jgi:uncharacterized protein (DUF433 family)
MDWRKYIVSNSKVMAGRPTLKGTRISVEFLLSLYASGWTHEQIQDEMPHLDPKALQACIACAADVLRLLVERELHQKFLPCVEEDTSLNLGLHETTNSSD